MKLPRPVWKSPVRHRPQSREHAHQTRQQRILALERELGIVPGPETELIPFHEKLQALCKQRDELQAAIRSSPEQAKPQELTDLNREILEAIRQLGRSIDRITTRAMERSGAEPHRRLHWNVTHEGQNQWLLQIRSFDPTTGSEEVRERRVIGRRNRKAMEELERAAEARKRRESPQ